MNKKQLTHLEKRLLEERARVMKELGYYDESFLDECQRTAERSGANLLTMHMDQGNARRLLDSYIIFCYHFINMINYFIRSPSQ